MIIHPAKELTDDGTHTLRHPVIGDTYHSTHGARTESEHIFIRNGFEECGEREVVRVLEVGFGSGLNALLTLRRAEQTGQRVEYTAIELYPIAVEDARGLCYAQDPMFIELHEAEWNAEVQVSELMTIKKVEADLVGVRFETIFDLVYFDAFAPDSQPELWSEEIFRTIFESMGSGGILVTYSSKGDVKRALRGAGFEVSRLAGPPGKRHMLRAAKP